ncbi:TatD family hydrolase, partial [Patescibacteria group bacterium]|nr:TatD family hydrolase [Patescibacteria group bacterium]
MLIDSHAHLNFKTFENDFDEVIKRSLAENIRMINVGSEYDTSKKAIEIAEKYNEVHATVGLHPIHAEITKNFHTSQCRSLCLSSPKVVAIGEIGLDYFRDYGKFKDRQKEVLLEQLDLAKELRLPIILHCRMAHDDLLDILKNYNLPGVIHCFTGNW